MQRNGKYNGSSVRHDAEKKNFKIEDDMQIVVFGKYAERSIATYGRRIDIVFGSETYSSGHEGLDEEHSVVDS